MFDNKVIFIELLERVKASVILAFQYQKAIRRIVEEIHCLNVDLALLGWWRDDPWNLCWKM